MLAKLKLLTAKARMVVKAKGHTLVMLTAAFTALVGVVTPEATTTIALGFFVQTLIAEA